MIVSFDQIILNHRSWIFNTYPCQYNRDIGCCKVCTFYRQVLKDVQPQSFGSGQIQRRLTKQGARFVFPLFSSSYNFHRKLSCDISIATVCSPLGPMLFVHAFRPISPPISWLLWASLGSPDKWGRTTLACAHLFMYVQSYRYYQVCTKVGN